MNHSSLRSKSFIASVAFALPGLGGNRLPFFSWSKAISNLAPASHAKNSLFELASSHPRMEEYVYHDTRNHQQRSQNCKAKINHIPHRLLIFCLLLLNLLRAHQVTRWCFDGSRFLRREYRLDELLNLVNFTVSIIPRLGSTILNK